MPMKNKSFPNTILYNQNCGFTLIEVLVVISIIGFMMSTVTATVSGARNKGNYAKARVEIDLFMKASSIAQGESAKRLSEITTNDCSACVCSGDLRNISSSNSCYVNWSNALTAIQNSTNGLVANLKMTRDPWGSPYLLDENEREGGPADCRSDTITTAGPDGQSGTGDDMGFLIPLATSPCP